MIKVPCKNCIVFPMCKARLIENNKVFNRSAQFAHLKGICDLVQEDYYEYNRTHYTSFTQESRLPYSQQNFPKAVLHHFNLPPNQYERSL